MNTALYSFQEQSVLLEALVLEFERLAVLRNGTNYVVRYSVRDVGLNLKSHLYFRAEQTGKVLDDFG